MITNYIAHWRSVHDNGKGISRAHLARHIGVDRSFVTKLEKGTAQPGADLMFRVARYFQQPVEAIFRHVDSENRKADVIVDNSIPVSHCDQFLATPPPTRPAGKETAKDKSLVRPTAKEVASLSRSKPKRKT